MRTDQEKSFHDELMTVQALTLAPQPSDQMPKFQLASVDERAVALLHCTSGSIFSHKFHWMASEKVLPVGSLLW